MFVGVVQGDFQLCCFQYQFQQGQGEVYQYVGQQVGEDDCQGGGCVYQYWYLVVVREVVEGFEIDQFDFGIDQYFGQVCYWNLLQQVVEQEDEGE